MSKRETPEFLRLQAKVIRDMLPELCRKENRYVEDVRRVAFHLVDLEDIKGQPPRNYSPAHRAAMKAERLERKAEDQDYPESGRRSHEENEAKLRRLFPNVFGDGDRTDSERDHDDENQDEEV